MAGKGTEERVEMIQVSSIIERGNPRSIFDPSKLASLSASIQARGIREPLLLRRGAKGRYEVISGARRLRAANVRAEPG